MSKKIIEGDVKLNKLYLDSLPDFLEGVEEVSGSFHCDNNRLTSLKNIPQKIRGSLYERSY